MWVLLFCQVLLCSLYEIYKALEEELDRNSSHLAVAPIYFPQELARLEALERDLEHFFGPDWKKKVIVPAATHKYEQRLRKVGKIPHKSIKKSNNINLHADFVGVCHRLENRTQSCWWPMHTLAILVIYQAGRCWGKLPRNLWGWAAKRGCRFSLSLTWAVPTALSSCTGAAWTASSWRSRRRRPCWRRPCRPSS